MSQSTWAANPFNHKQTYAEHSLPQLLFRQCHLNCVDSETFVAENAGEKLCVQNCQEKTYQAFDMYIAIKAKMDAKRGVDKIIDISRYTEMEIEHGHDTANTIKSKQGVHL